VGAQRELRGMNEELSLERAKKQFAEVINLIRQRAQELQKTKEGRDVLRREIAALQGVHPDMVKLEADEL